MLLPTVIVMVEVPEPGAGIGLGLKEVPPPADKVIAESKPFPIFAVMVDVPELPLAMVSALGEALMANLPVAEAVTVKVTVVVCVTPPPMPVTVMG